MPPHILLVQQEWPRDFHRSTQWAYLSSLGYVESLENCGAEVTLLTTPWIPHAERLIANRRVDQVWIIDLVHLEADASFYDWIVKAAPVRVGLIGESLEHTQEELRENPEYAERGALVESRAAFMTHLFPVDEVDAQRLSASGFATRWMPGAIPRSLIVAESAVQPSGPVGFIGSIYDKRRRFFAHPALVGRVFRVTPSDRTPELEARYQELAELSESVPTSDRDLRARHRDYCAGLIEVRREVNRLYLAAFSAMGATLNPPSIVKTFPGRVWEAISQGIPVIHWRIPERPGSHRLLEGGSEILPFDDGDFDELVRAMDLLRDPDYARALALRARRRVLADHTLEARCAGALGFIEETAGEGPC